MQEWETSFYQLKPDMLQWVIACKSSTRVVQSLCSKTPPVSMWRTPALTLPTSTTLTSRTFLISLLTLAVTLTPMYVCGPIFTALCSRTHYTHYTHYNNTSSHTPTHTPLLSLCGCFLYVLFVCLFVFRWLDIKRWLQLCFLWFKLSWVGSPPSRPPLPRPACRLLSDSPLPSLWSLFSSWASSLPHAPQLSRSSELGKPWHTTCITITITIIKNSNTQKHHDIMV